MLTEAESAHSNIKPLACHRQLAGREKAEKQTVVIQAGWNVQKGTQDGQQKG